MARQSLRTETAAIVFVIMLAVVASIGVISFISHSGNGVNSSSTSTTNGEQPPSSYSVTAPSGLELNLNLNATTMGVGSALGAQITFFNPLKENLSIPVEYSSNSKIAAWTDSDFVCGGNSLYFLAAYALFQGRYSPENVSSAGTPLLLAPPAGFSCLSPLRPNVVIFLPNSSNASLGEQGGPYQLSTNVTTEYCENVPNLAGTYSTSCPVGTSVFGYWAQVNCCLEGDKATTSSPYFHYLPPGEYTLVVEDEWNQTICAPFLVSAASDNHVGAVSVAIAGYGQEGREVSVSLENVGQAPIASLNASLTGFPTSPTAVYSFVFNTSSSRLLLAGQIVQSTPTLVGSGIDPAKQYPLTVTGTLSNGTQFAYTKQVWVIPLGQG